MIQSFRRSAYLFLSAMLGLLMFFILHRIVVFFYLFFATLGDTQFEYYHFLVWDYSTLILVLLLGIFYGLWLGKYWYAAVYYEKLHGGLLDYVNTWLWGQKMPQQQIFQKKLETVSERLERNLADLESLSMQTPVQTQAKPKIQVRRATLSPEPKPAPAPVAFASAPFATTIKRQSPIKNQTPAAKARKPKAKTAAKPRAKKKIQAV